MNQLFQYLNILSSLMLLILFTLISAYVSKFSIKRSGLVQDYVMFAIVTIIALKMGGAL